MVRIRIGSGGYGGKIWSGVGFDFLWGWIGVGIHLISHCFISRSFERFPFFIPSLSLERKERFNRW